SRKDMINRLRIVRKEAKEAKHHLELIEEANPEFKSRMQNLINESDELKRIFSAIIDKLTND
ncbi:MAG: four helix bundle protein, partial [Patescibacteria group bacterium]